MLNFFKLYFDKFSQSSPKTKISLAIITLALFIHAFLTFGSHYTFRSHYWDLAAHTQPLWEYMQGRMAHFPGDASRLMLSDHFSPALILYSPLVLIFKSYTLLIVQYIFLIIGALGIHKYLQNQAPQALKYSPWIWFFFFTHWGIVAAINYDFHNNVPAAMLIPWLILFFQQQKAGKFFLVLSFMLICQENTSFYCGMLLLALTLEKLWKLWKTALHTQNSSGNNRYIYIYSKLLLQIITQIPWWYFAGILLCFGYFFLLISVVLPSIHYVQLSRYAHLGSGALDIAWNIICEPTRILIPYQQASPKELREALHGLCVMIFGAIWLIGLRPWLLIAVLGYTAQRFLSNTPTYWSQHYQYSVELSPLLTILFIDQLSKWHKWINTKTRLWIMTILVIVSAWASERNVKISLKIKGITQSLCNKGVIPIHELYKAIAKVPDSCTILTQEQFSAHLYRRYAGQLQELNEHSDLSQINTEYILVCDLHDHLLNQVQALRKLPNYSPIYQTKQVSLLKRKDENLIMKDEIMPIK